MRRCRSNRLREVLVTYFRCLECDGVAVEKRLHFLVLVLQVESKFIRRHKTASCSSFFPSPFLLLVYLQLILSLHSQTYLFRRRVHPLVLIGLFSLHYITLHHIFLTWPK